ncbi:MAG: GUN4 domain-containing protein, partial [Sphaerospermopsis kisseleviana]
WVKYSEGRFGFSVQKEIYQEVGGTREYNKEIWENFGDRVGWRKDYWLMYNQLNFTTDAYKDAKAGHLPRGGEGGVLMFGLGFGSLASRLVKCNL